MVLVVVVIGALNLLLGLGPAGVLVAVVVGCVAAVAAWWKSDAVALSVSHARPTNPQSQPRLHNLVEGLCIAAGLPKPGVYVVEDPAPNAFATGRSPAHASVVVTTGLLDTLSRIELEGLLAHELSHVKSYDILPSTLAVTVLWPVTAVSSRPMRISVSPHREVRADFSAVTLTRYPPGLIAALEKLGAATAGTQSSSRAISHLWTVSPPARTKAGGRLAWTNRLFDSHPPLEDRIQALKEL